MKKNQTQFEPDKQATWSDCYHELIAAIVDRYCHNDCYGGVRVDIESSRRYKMQDPITD